MLKLLQQGIFSFESLSKLGRGGGFCRLASTVTSANQQQKTEEKDDKQESLGSRPAPPVSDSRKGPFLNEQEASLAHYRFVYPEFLPDPNLKLRNRIKEKLERMDMLKRRSNIDIPEFYVGSILSVTVSDKNAPGKTTTFVGLCTERDKAGLRANFTLRNVVDDHGIEICYDMYNPTILNITCLRLEKRLDENLRYLRDCPLEYSTFPFDMVPELRSMDAPVPINPLKVKINPPPWIMKWQTHNLKGIENLEEYLEPWQLKKRETWKFQTGQDTLQYDLMKVYRSTTHAEDQGEIYSEVHHQLAKLTASLRKQKRKRAFVKPQKTV